ncbi:MAG: macro domain-containing protein, partial [Deltaproteobacteria bacterium]|nr:macro domain-containing protein [Deltaproteobacteria bacterium]
EKELRSIAFPAISCGAYGYPAAAAVAIAVSTVRDFLRRHKAPLQVIFVCFKQDMADLYRRQLRAPL